MDWEELRNRQREDSKLMEVIRKIEELSIKDFRVRENGTMDYQDRRVILADLELRDWVLREGHNTPLQPILVA